MNKDTPILLVDDSQDQLSVIALALTKSIPKVNIVTAQNEAQVASFLTDVDQGTTTLPRIVLLDLYIPHREDGLRILAAIKQHLKAHKRPAIPVIIFTCSDHIDDVKACYDSGATTYITKPLMLDRSIALFKTFAQYWFDTVVLPDAANVTLRG